MKKRNLKSREVHAIGDKVITAVRLTDCEIDKIVSSPTLFESIRRAVEAERPLVKVAELPTARVSIFRRPIAVLAAAGLILAGLATVAGVIRNGEYSDGVAGIKEIVRPIGTLEPEPLTFDPETPNAGPARTGAPGRLHRKTAVAAARYRPRQIDRSAEEQLGEFQAVTYIGDGMDGKGRIVRVELPRSSLYAMGINVPVENDAASIKADLLIGSDGVMRAVRVVKMD